MRHIALTSFDAPPCNGEIHFTPPVEKAASIATHRSLPILGQQTAEVAAAGTWTCQRCGQKWSREPLPQEAL